MISSAALAVSLYYAESRNQVILFGQTLNVIGILASHLNDQKPG